MYSATVLAELQTVLKEDYGCSVSGEELLEIANALVGVFSAPLQNSKNDDEYGKTQGFQTHN